MTRRLTHAGILLAIILLGFALRLYQVDVVPFRGDEAFSVQRWTAAPLSVSLTEIAAIEPHPVLTYVLFRIWGQIIGIDSEFALRMLPVLANLIGIPALYALSTRLGKSSAVGLLAAGLWAIHPFQIWHAQDFRNYGIWAGLSVITLWLGLRVLQRRKRKDWFLYTVVALATALLFYNELLTVGVMGLYALLVHWRDRGLLMKWLALNTAIIAITIGSFVILQGDLITGGGYSGTTGGLTIAQIWNRFLPVLAFGDTLAASLQSFPPAPEGWVYWPGLVLLLGGLWIVIWQENRERAVFLAVLLVAPIIVLALISTRLYIFRPRYVLMAAPAIILIVSHGSWRLAQTRNLRIIAGLILVGWVGLSLYSLDRYYHNSTTRKTPEWPALVRYLENETSSDDVIIQTGVDAGFGYYYTRGDVPADEFALPADVTQPREEIIKTLARVSEQYVSLWIVGQTFPDWPNAGVVESWAEDHLQLTRETQIAGLPVRQYMQWDVDAGEMGPRPLATFEGVAQLYRTQIYAPDPMNTLTVRVYWKALEQTEAPLTVFVHLVGDINPATNTPLWSQDDHPPQNGRIRTDNWQPDTFYRDIFVLPLDQVPAGDYRIEIGFYDPQTGERVSLSPTVSSVYAGTVSLP